MVCNGLMRRLVVASTIEHYFAYLKMVSYYVDISTPSLDIVQILQNILYSFVKIKIHCKLIE